MAPKKRNLGKAKAIASSSEQEAQFETHHFQTQIKPEILPIPQTLPSKPEPKPLMSPKKRNLEKGKGIASSSEQEAQFETHHFQTQIKPEILPIPETLPSKPEPKPLMAPKKQNLGKRKGIASSSEQGAQFEGRQKKRSKMDAYERTKWKESIEKKGVKNERYIDISAESDHPAMTLVRHALDRQGLSVWYRYKNPGYNLALVREFYKHMDEPADYRAENAKIVSKIGRIPVEINVAKIAGILRYERPQGETSYPRPIDQGLIVDRIYERRADFKGLPYQAGKLRQAYRLVNQLVCYNILPRGTENRPGDIVGELMWAFMDPETVCDWALYIFGQMVEYRWMPKVVRMPFPCMLTNILWAEHQLDQIRLPQQYFKKDTLDPGEINATVLNRSLSQGGRPTRPVTAPLAAMPGPESKIKVWLKKLFCQNVAIMDSHRKIKKKLAVQERRSADNDAKLDYYIKLQRGETSDPYVPHEWPELEVSDDFAGQGEEEEEEEAGDEIEEEEEEDD